jgi:Concanavalin A-like lectin/glucanases superfamily
MITRRQDFDSMESGRTTMSVHACLLASRTSRETARRVGAAVLAAAFALSNADALAQSCVATPGAVYWLAGERSYDDLAEWHNATLVGPDVGFVPGRVGDGVHFGGTIEDRVYTDTTYAEERAIRHAFTIELWARPSAELMPCNEASGGTCAQAQPWVVFPEHGDNSAPPGETGLAAGIGLAIGTNGVCVGEHTSNVLPCLARFDTPITDWTHVAVVVEDRTPRIYLDGVPVHTGQQSTLSFVFASWSVIGSIHVGGYGVFAGDIDELTVYRRALADEEIAALFAAGAEGKCKPACAVERDDDLWQGALVGDHSPILSNLPDCLFGATGCSPESDTLLFADGLPDGTVHSIEWSTATPFTLGGIALHAYHDAPDNTQRAFRHVLIEGRPSGGTYSTLYASDIALPYGQGADGRELRRCVNVRPSRLQEFRAEFVQDGEGPFSGPRVEELDGILRDPIFADDFDFD